MSRITSIGCAALAGAFLACAALVGTATAGPAEDSEISRLITAGNVAEAKAILDATNPSEADKVFFVARVLKSRGQYEQAIAGFRRVLQLDPKHLNARRELAHTLLLARDYDDAEAQFKRLTATDPNPRMQEGYDRFLGVIRANKPFGFSGYASVLPSSNLNRGTDNTAFDTALGSFVIDPSSRAQPGTGVELGASVFLRMDLDEGQRLQFDLSAAIQHYPTGGYDSLSGTLSARFDQRTDWGGWYLNPFVNASLRDDSGDLRAPGLRVGADYTITPKDRVNVALSHEYRFFPEAAYREGGFSSAVVSYSHQVDPSLAFSLGYAFERSRPQAAHLQYDGHKGFARVSKSWDGGLITGAGVEAGMRGFVGNFPLTTSPRDDLFYKLDATVSHSKFTIMGFLPQVGCSYTVNGSNVAFYDYAATDCRAGLTRDF